MIRAAIAITVTGTIAVWAAAVGAWSIATYAARITEEIDDLDDLDYKESGMT